MALSNDCTYNAVTNTAGLSASATVTITVRDTTPPRITCGAADATWHGTDAVVACSAADGGSGLATAADASFVLTTAVAAGVETAGAFTAARTVCDAAGNCATAGPIGPFRIDRKAPSITIVAPPDGATFILKQKLAASFSCADDGAGLAACRGTAAAGAPLDTDTVGAKTFTVTATDAAGNQSSVTRAYTVTFAGGGKCLFNEGHTILWPIAADGTSAFLKGPPVPARFRVCDANGRSVGSPGVVSNFRLVQTVLGGVAQAVDQPVPSVLSPPVFKWDPLLQEWEFGIDTRNYARATTYVFRVRLADASVIAFRFALR